MITIKSFYKTYVFKITPVHILNIHDKTFVMITGNARKIEYVVENCVMCLNSTFNI